MLALSLYFIINHSAFFQFFFVAVIFLYLAVLSVTKDTVLTERNKSHTFNNKGNKKKINYFQDFTIF